MNQQDQPQRRATLYRLPPLSWTPPSLLSVLWWWGLATGIGVLPAFIPVWIGVLLMFKTNNESAFMIIATITVAAMATPIALFQHIALDLLGGVDGWWARATIGGAAAGVGLIMLDQQFDVSSILLWFLFGDDFDTTHTWLAVPLELICLGIGFCQWLVLRRTFEYASGWIGANLLAGLVIGWIGEIPGQGWMQGLLQLLAYTLITGAMLRLLLGKLRFNPGQD